MSFKDFYYNDYKKKKEEEESGGNFIDFLKKNANDVYKQEVTDVDDESAADRFNAWNSSLSSLNTKTSEFNTDTWHDSSYFSTYESDTTNALEEGKKLYYYLLDKGDKETATAFKETLDYLSKFQSGIKSASEYYAQWDSEESYGEWKTWYDDQQKKLALDTAAEEQLIAEMERARDEAKFWEEDRKNSSSPETTTGMPSAAVEPAAPYAPPPAGSASSTTKPYTTQAPKKEEEPENRREDYVPPSGSVDDRNQNPTNTELQNPYLSQYAFTSVAELEQAIANKKVYLREAQEIQKVTNLQEEAKADPEFNSWASQGAAIENPDVLIGKTSKDANNMVTFERDKYEVEKGLYELYDSKDATPLPVYMTEDEVSVWNYHLAQDKVNGTNKANEYYQALLPTLEKRKAYGIAEEKMDNVVESTLFSLSTGVETFFTNVGNLFSDEDYIAPTVNQMAQSIIRQEYEDDGNWLATTTLDLASTTGNMLPAILASYATAGAASGVGLSAVAAGILGKGAMALSMGVSSMGAGYAEMLNLGYSKDQARAYGAMVGIAETASSYLLGSIGGGGKGADGALSGLTNKILGKVDNALARVAIQIGGSMGSEFIEEGLQTAIEPWLKSVATGVDFEAAGIDEILYSGLLGALSAGVLEGQGIVRSNVKAYNQGKRIQNVDGGVQKLQQIGNTFSADSVAYKLANKVDENTGAYTIGRLFQEVGATISEQNVADIVAGLEAKGVATEAANTIARDYQAYVNEEIKLSQKGVEILEKNDTLAQVIRNNLIGRNTTVYQRSKEYADLYSLAERVSNGETDAAEEKSSSVEGETTGEQGDLQVAQNIQKSILKEFSSTPSLYSSVERKLATDDKIMRTAADIAVEDKLGIQGKYTSNDSGATRIKDTKQKVKILDVVSVKNGDLRLKVSDGKAVKTVSAKNVNFSTASEALVYEAVANMGVDAATAWSIIKGFDPKSNQSGAVYALGVTEAYGYGRSGLEETDISDRGFAKTISEVQRNTAHRLGKIAKDIEQKAAERRVKNELEVEGRKAKSEQKALNAKVKDSGKKSEEKKAGRVILDGGINRKSLAKDELRSSQIKVLEKLAEKLGVTFHLYESKVEKVGGKDTRVYTDASGKKITASGMYSRATGEVWVDINAGNSGEGFILYTASHELTHFIKQWSPEKYQIFANFLIEQYGKKGVSVNELINEQIAKAKRNGRTLSREAALAEVVADSCESFLMDSNIAEKISLLSEKDKSIVEKIKSFIGSLLKKLRGIFAEEGFAPNSAEGRFVQEMTDALEQLHSLWSDALVDASRTYGKLNVQQVNTLAESGIGVDEVTGEVYALRDSFATNDKITIGKKSFDIEAVAALVKEATGRSIEDARKWVKSEMTIANLVMKNPEFLDFEVDDRYEAIKKNSDYPQGTVDLSNLCPKRQEFTSMFDMLQKKYPNKLFTASDVAKMRAILAEEGITVACGACFVEDRRQLLGEIADTYINMWKEAVDTGKPLHKTNAEGKKIKLTVTAALAKQYGVTKGADILATDKYIPTQYDLTTYEGFKLLEKNHSTIAMGFNRYNNSRGQQSGRLIEGRAEYKRQILGWSENKVKTVNNNGGLRIFSFSDFEVVHLLDLVQVIIDCAAKGVKIQGYTKIPAFAKLVRNTGIKLNRSFIPKGETGIKVVNGKRVLDIDNTEGINTNDENFLDESDNPDVGNVIIGINPEQIGIAMMDETIDYIIPFHSNKSKDILQKLGLKEWVNYKESQHEKDIDTGKASKHNVNIYTQVINKYKPTNKVEFVEAFLKECKAQGKIPRYSEFLNVDSNGDYAYREGYHKFLVDFKMFDKEGNILPQGFVTPDLNDAFMTELLNDEVDKKANYEFPQEVYDKIEEQFGEDVQYSERYIAVDANSDILSMVDKVSNGAFKANDKVYLGTVSDNIATRIFDLTGIRVNGFKIAIEARQVEHILKDHGVSGLADHSMADPNDIAKMGYALNDPDDIRASGKTKAYTHMVNGRNKTADTVLYEKNIGEKSYYVVQAVPDTNAKTLYIVTAFIGKKGYKKEASQLINAKSLDATAKTGSANASANIVPHPSDSVKGVEAKEFSDGDTMFSIREEEPPKKTIEGYKVFVVKNGKLYPPMVANPNAEDTPVGVWLNADVGARAPDSKTGRAQVKAGGKGTQGGGGSLAFRPGWHLGETPLATQFDRTNPETGVKELFPENFVWALCDVAADHDYQEEAMSYGYTKNGKFQHSLAGLPKLPTDGYYKYRTNPNPDTVPWLITGAMKVKKILSDAEVNAILKEKGLAPKQRVGGEKTLADLGLSQYEDVVFSEREIVDIPNNKYVDLYHHFGSTKNYDVAGYMLGNGVMLDFSGKHWGDTTSRSRQVDHRDVQEVLDDRGNNGINAMIDMIGNGNIRLMPEVGGINLAVKPNETQMTGLRGYINHFRGEVVVDIDKVGGDTIHSFEYTRGTSSSKILSDIKAYFDNGVVPDQKEKGETDIRQFLYQDRDPDAITDRELLSNALVNAAKNDIEKKRLKEYSSKIERLNAEDKKLGELNEQIKALSFAKGKRDAAKLRGLRDEKIRTENRINTLDKMLLSLEASKPLREVLKREKDMVRKREQEKSRENFSIYKSKQEERMEATREYYREIIRDNARKARESKETAISNLKQKHYERLERAQDRRDSSALRTKIKAFKQKLEQNLLRPTERQYVPAGLAQAMIDVFDLIDTDTELYKADGTINKAQEKRNLTKEKLQALKDEYEKLKKFEDPIYSGEFDEAIYAMLTDLRDRYEGKSLKEMDVDELYDMYDILRSIEETLADARKLIGKGEAADVYETGYAIIGEQDTIARKRKNGKRSGAAKAKDSVINLSLSPIRNIERMSGYKEDSALVDLFNDFEVGVRTKNRFAMDAYKDFEAITTGKNAKAYESAIYDDYKGKKYLDDKGRKFGVSKMQMMQAILSQDREKANKMTHIEKGGLNFADLGMLRKGRLKDAISNENSHRVSNATAMVESFREELREDKWAQEYMAVARNFFDGKAKDAVNETMLALKHRIVAKDKNYIPFEVDKNFIVREISAANDIQQTINSYGMLQETKSKAPQPLIMTGLNNVIDRHIDQVATIAGLAIPVRNFNKVWNVHSVDGVDTTVNNAVEENWGKEGKKHIEQVVQDIQGPRQNNQSELYKKVKSGYIGATFLLNGSVVAKQIGSLFSATSMIRWRDPLRMTGNLLYTMANFKKIAAEVDKYTASAWMRRQGMSDAEVYTLLTEGKKSKITRTLNKLPAPLNPSKWITAMDSAVALSLWKYCKADVKKAHPDLKGEELNRATANFYDTVIENTQSMSDVLHRPEIQKRNDIVSETFGMFKTDLYQMAGQLQNTLGKFNAKKSKKNTKALARTVYSIAASAVWGQLMTTVFALLRYKVNQYRDDEDELTVESWLKRQGFAWGGDLAGYAFPLFGSEIVGTVENIVYGESEDIADSLALTAINDLYSSLVTMASTIKEGEEPTRDQYKKVAIKSMQVFGIPANNILRTVEAVQLHAQDIANGEFFSFEAGKQKSKVQLLYEAILDGDAEDIKAIQESYKTQEAFDSAMKQALRINDTRIRDAAIAHLNGNVHERVSLKDVVAAEEYFSEEIVEGAIKGEISAFNTAIGNALEARDRGDTEEYNEIINDLVDKGYPKDLIDKKLAGKAEDSANADEDEDEIESDYSASDIGIAYDNGYVDMALDVIKDLVKVKTENYINDGEKKKDAEKKAKASVRSTVTSYWKPIYLQAYKSKNDSEMRRIRYILKDTDLYDNVVETCQDWIKQSKK